MIYFTSDLHFGHSKDFLYEPRGFPTIEEHDNTIIQRWNEVVCPEDEVYILGDLMLNDNIHGVECLNKLNGIKHFIRGNHDTSNRIKLYQKECNLIDEGYATILKYKKYRFYLSHYPTITSNGEQSLKAMTINLFGHTHQQDNFYENKYHIYHVGIDSHNCYPISIENIIEEIKIKYMEDIKE